jgi:hypothetical protein
MTQGLYVLIAIIPWVTSTNIRFGSKADIAVRLSDVRLNNEYGRNADAIGITSTPS